MLANYVDFTITMKQLTKPKLPENHTLEQLEEYHRNLRRWNSERVIRGIATPDDIRRENRWLIPVGVEAKIDWTYAPKRKAQ